MFQLLKMTVTRRLNLLPHEARPVVLCGPNWCGGHCCCRAVVVFGKRRGFVCSSGSWHSMPSTYGPQDIISLVTPSLGGLTSLGTCARLEYMRTLTSPAKTCAHTHLNKHVGISKGGALTPLFIQSKIQKSNYPLKENLAFFKNF